MDNQNYSKIIREEIGISKNLPLPEFKTNDPLKEFLFYFLKNCSSIGFIPLFSEVKKIDNVTSAIWYRKGQFQVQLFMVLPNTIIPEHTHPNVDSYEVYLGGQIRFSHSSKYAYDENALYNPDENGLSLIRGDVIRVKPNDLHGGVFGEMGGVFMSVQHWLNDVKPHCVAADYIGGVMGIDHLNHVTFGKPEFIEKLSAKDAASNEV